MFVSDCVGDIHHLLLAIKYGNLARAYCRVANRRRSFHADHWQVPMGMKILYLYVEFTRGVHPDQWQFGPWSFIHQYMAGEAVECTSNFIEGIRWVQGHASDRQILNYCRWITPDVWNTQQ